MLDVANSLARSKGKIVCLDINGAVVPAGDPNAVSMRVEGMELARNGSFRIAATWNHPNPPPPSKRRCRTVNGALPVSEPSPVLPDEDAEIAVIDASRIEPNEDPPAAAPVKMDDIEITYFIKAGGILTKILSRALDGSLLKDSSRCKMFEGEHHRVRLGHGQQALATFAHGLEKLPPNTAIALGRLRADLPNICPLITKAAEAKGKVGVTRTGNNICYEPGKPAFVLLDCDDKGMPQEVKAKFAEIGGFIPALERICPNFDTSGYICRRSTSTVIIDGVLKEGGWHVFLMIADGAEAERFLKLLHKKAWLAGLGWHVIANDGKLLERSIIDLSVYQGERLCFEADAIFAPGQGLERAERPAHLHDGASLNTQAFCIDLVEKEQAKFRRLVKASKEALEPDAAEVKAAFMQERVEIAIAGGMDKTQAEIMAARWTEGILTPGATIDFEKFGPVDVADVRADPNKYDNASCFDPIEGRAYGHTTGKFYANSMCVHSFAHGKRVFQLRGEEPKPSEARGGVEFILGEKGQILANHPANIRRAIEELDITLKHNELADIIEVSGLPPYIDGKELTGPGSVRLRMLISETFGFLPGRAGFDDVVIDIAHASGYHPVKEYFESIKGKRDNHSRIDTWMIDYAGAENTALNRAFGRIWMVAAVRRIMHPGAKFDTIITFEGLQGKNKSTAMETLAVNPDWFTDDLPIGEKSKVVIEQTEGAWIVEFPDLTGMSKRELREVKSFAARRKDRARLAYGRKATTVLRQWTGAATSNDDEYLGDNENRRWWPVKVKKFDVEKLRADRDLLWAEAIDAEAMGESITLPEQLWAAAAEVQAERRIPNAFYDALLPILGHKEKEGWVRSNALWIRLDIDVNDRNRHVMKVGEAMRDLGFVKERIKKDGDPRGPRDTRVWVRGTANIDLGLSGEPLPAPAPQASPARITNPFLTTTGKDGECTF